VALAGIHNLTLERGVTFHREIKYEYQPEGQDALQPINLFGATAEFQVRKNKSSTTTLLSLYEGNGITMDGANGLIMLDITDEDTDGIDFNVGYYDLKVIYPTGQEERILQGRFAVSREVTR
jgi:hypothetical protein